MKNTTYAAPAYLIAGLGGAVLWIGAAIISGRTEAWDSGLYWMIAYPLTIGLAACWVTCFPCGPGAGR